MVSKYLNEPHMLQDIYSCKMMLYKSPWVHFRRCDVLQHGTISQDISKYKGIHCILKIEHYPDILNSIHVIVNDSSWNQIS